MRDLRMCAQLVGVLGLLAACGDGESGAGRKTALSRGRTAHTSEDAPTGVAGTLGGGDAHLPAPSEGGAYSSSQAAPNTNATANGGYGVDSSGGRASGNSSGVGGTGAANTLTVGGSVGTSIGGSPSGDGSQAVGGSSPSTGSSPAALGGSNTGGAGPSAAGGSSAMVGGAAPIATGGAPSPPDPERVKSQCSGKPGPSYDQFFDNGKLATLRINVDASVLGGKTPADALWEKWSHCPPHEASEFLPVSFAYESPDGVGSVSCENVGMRFRGSRGPTSTYTQVPGFKLDVQVLEADATPRRRFADLNRINILSIEMDDKSHMLQCLAFKAMRDFNIPSPRCNHLMVYVNGTYYGLLENVEQVNRGYVRRHFGTNTGYLFAASPSQEDCTDQYKFKDSLAKLNYSGDAFSNYATQYMLDSATPEAAEQTLIPMLKCGDATQTPDNEQFKACIQEWIDVDEWLRFIAASSLIPELQSWLGYYRNGYLYFRPDPSAPRGGRFAIWSWDLDTAYNTNTCYPSNCDPFKAVDGLYGPRNARSKFINRLTTVFRGEYCTLLKSFLSTVYQPTLVDNMAQVIEAGVANDPHTTPEAWQLAVSSLREYIVSHGAQMQTLVDAGCQ